MEDYFKAHFHVRTEQISASVPGIHDETETVYNILHGLTLHPISSSIAQSIQIVGIPTSIAKLRSKIDFHEARLQHFNLLAFSSISPSSSTTNTQLPTVHYNQTTHPNFSNHQPSTYNSNLPTFPCDPTAQHQHGLAPYSPYPIAPSSLLIQTTLNPHFY